MLLLTIGLILFLAIHSVSIIGEGWRDQMVEKLGEWPWKGLYAVVSILGFVLLVKGYALARQDPTLLYASPVWLRHGAIVLLLPVFPLILSAYLPGRIQAAAGHPMLVATQIWAFAHLLANGMLADVMLFGSLLAWAAIDQRSLSRRTARTIPMAPRSAANDAIAIIAGLGLYAGFLFGIHSWLIGVPIF